MAENAETVGSKAEVAEGESTLVHRIAEKADKLKFVFLGALVVIVAVAVFVSYQRRAAAAHEAQAENAFYQANIDLLKTPDADPAPIFGKLAKEYAGLPVGGRSLMSQFSFAFNTDKFAEAEAAMRQFIKEYPRHPMIPRAKLALAQSVVEQKRYGEAIGMLRDIVSTAGPDLLAESKFALAQALELEAEEVRDNPEEYRIRLDRASSEYNDIVVRARNPSPQSGFWPQSIVVPADFALVVIKDRLAGHEHIAPVRPETSASGGGDSDPVMAIPPPPADEAAGEPAPESPAEATPGDAGEEPVAEPEPESAPEGAAVDEKAAPAEKPVAEPEPEVAPASVAVDEKAAPAEKPVGEPEPEAAPASVTVDEKAAPAEKPVAEPEPEAAPASAAAEEQTGDAAVKPADEQPEADAGESSAPAEKVAAEAAAEDKAPAGNPADAEPPVEDKDAAGEKTE